MIHLFTASTLYQVASLAALIDSGLHPGRGERVLVLADGSQQPELTGGLQRADGFGALASRFDRIVDLGALVWPLRAQQFSPRDGELHIWERLLRSAWGLGEATVELVLDTIQANPSQALARIFHDAPVSVHSDGLMSYGPTRKELPLRIRQRLERIYYTDIVPSLRPLLLHEANPTLVPVPAESMATVFRELAAKSEPSDALAQAIAAANPTGLVLGQYLADLGILDDAEESGLHRSMLAAAADAGCSTVLFKPHPSTSPTSAARLAAEAQAMGLDFAVLYDPVPAEVVALRLRPRLIVSCFSTALITTRTLFGADCQAVGTHLLLDRLTPYENSNRIPVTLIDALLVRSVPTPAEDPAGADGQLQRLVETVAYCMQSKQLPGLRATAAEFLRTGLPQHGRYFRRRRLSALDLPGGALEPAGAAPSDAEPTDADLNGADQNGAGQAGAGQTGASPAVDAAGTAQRVSPAREPRKHTRAFLRIGRAGRKRLGRLRRLGRLDKRPRPETRHANSAE